MATPRPDTSPATPDPPDGTRPDGDASERDDDVPETLEALRKLAPRGRRRRVPYVQQLTSAGCGAACLTMVLRYHGNEARLDDVREAMGITHHGTSAFAILREAEERGMRGRAIRLDIDDLHYLPPATILHWAFNHFVVFERVTRRGVQIVDPAFGRRVVRFDAFRRSFTGVAIPIEPAETFEITPGQRSRGWAYLRQLLGQRHVLSRIIVTSILLRLFALALPILTGLVVDQVVPRGELNLLLVVGAGLGILLVFQFLSELIRMHLLLQLRSNLDIRMTLGFLGHLVALPYEFFQRRSAGDLMMRVNSNTMVRELITSNTLSALLDGALVLIYLCLIFLVSSSLGFLVLGLGCLQILIFALSRRAISDLMSSDLEVQARSRSYLVELLGGIQSLKVAGAENLAVERWSHLFVDELNVSLQRGRLTGLINAMLDVLKAGSPLLILGYGAILVMQGDMSLGTMLAMSALATGFLTPLSILVDSALRLQLLGSYIERIDDVLSTDAEQDTGDAVKAPRLRGQVTLDKVSFRYDPHGPFVVRDVSLSIDAGMSVAIVGKSGAGKSTLANLIVGLYRPSEGQVFHDGHELEGLDLRSVRRQCGVVPQHPYIFGSSIRENIALTNPYASLGDVIAAARAACIHDDIMAMPMQYNSLVADGGASLSGGQRQRLALARALVRRPAMLLLDEATSSLDIATEQAVARNLSDMRCTRIIIAHRLSTVISADRIIVLKDGEVVEIGRHDELVALAGTYAALIAADELGGADD